MNAMLFRPQESYLAGLAMTGIAMLTVLSALPALANQMEDSPARITQQGDNNSIYNNFSEGVSLKIVNRPLEEFSGFLNGHHGNHATIYQNGSRNTGSITQAHTAGYSAGNLALLYQHGNNNNADISQSGGFNLGIIYQEGSDLSATITQTGGNIQLQAAINQFGSNADATINQFGRASRGVSIEQLSRSGAGMAVTVETR